MCIYTFTYIHIYITDLKSHFLAGCRFEPTQISMWAPHCRAMYTKNNDEHDICQPEQQHMENIIGHGWQTRLGECSGEIWQDFVDGLPHMETRLVFFGYA